MGFNAEAFLSASFAPRTAEIKVPDLKAWFPDGDPAVWKVRGLTGNESAQCREAFQRRRNLGELVSRLLSPDAKKKAQALREEMGLDDGDMTEDLVQRIHMLHLGSVEPACPEKLAAKLCRFYPVPFYEITTQIIVLTGLGYDPGKASVSGGPPTSETV